MSVSPEVSFTFNMTTLCTHIVFRALSNPHLLFMSNAETERANSTGLKKIKHLFSVVQKSLLTTIYKNIILNLFPTA